MKFGPAILMFLVYPAMVTGQQSMQQHHSKFSVGLSYSADHTFRHLNYTAENAWLGTIRNDQEKPGYGFATGISVNYKINDRFFLESGLVYSNIGYKTKPSDLEWTDLNNAYAVRSFTSYHHQFINVPVKLNYVFKGKRLKFFAGAGISVNRFIGTKTTITREYENGQKKTRSSRTQLPGTNSMNLSAIVSSGLNYQASNRLYFKLEPVLRRSLTSIGHNSNSREYYYSIGINSALMYSLRERRKRK